MDKLRSAEELWNRLAKVEITDREVIDEINAYASEVARACADAYEAAELDGLSYPGDASEKIKQAILAVAKPLETTRERLGRVLYGLVWVGGAEWDGQPGPYKERYINIASALLAEQDKIRKEAYPSPPPTT